MESDEIPLEVVHCIVDVLLGHARVDHKVDRGWWSRWVVREKSAEVRVLEGVKRKVPPDVVGAWISPDYVFEPASENLVVVGGVPPAANAKG